MQPEFRTHVVRLDGGDREETAVQDYVFVCSFEVE